MQGFDDRWRDLPDYIIGITRDIWEGRQVASLHRYYADDIIFRMAAGIGHGNRDVIAATLATMAEFPDRELLAEDVIWSGTPADGMLSSHRLFCQATHTGPGLFGAATGKRVQFRAIADCHAKNGVIDDEWLTRDYGAICRQLGHYPRDVARMQIGMDGGKRPFTPDQDRVGLYTGRGNDHTAGAELADILKRIMDADISTIRKSYDRAARVCTPGGAEGRSYAASENFWIGLRAAFPSATFTIDHQIGRDDAGLGTRAAIRWSLHGTHEGWGTWGAPTGAQVYIMGFTHATFGPWGLREEFTLFDEVAIWKQIALHTG